MKEVYVIILDWNGWQDTVECVESCLRLNYPNFSIIIVDNGSTDGSEAILRNRFPDIKLIQTGTNLGFAGGNNVGIKYALTADADYIWLLNNDTIVDQNSLIELINVAESNGKIGVVGSKIYYYNDIDKIWFAGGRMNYITTDCSHIGYSKRDNGQYDEIKKVDYITGCSLLIKRNVILEVGVMDERYFLLVEEAEWQERIKRRGYKTVFVPKSKIWHKVSQSIGEDSLMWKYYLTRNSLLFSMQHYRLYFIIALIKKLYRGIKSFVFGEKEAGKYIFMGIKDFLISRYGQFTPKE